MSKMAKKMDAKAAAKAKKQKIILIGGAVLLLGMAALQGPKLLGGGGETEATPAATSGSGTTLTPVSTTSPGGTTVPAGTPTTAVNVVGSVAGVPLPAGVAVVAARDQLVSFTLFEVKDPFIQQSGATAGEEKAPDVIPSGDEPLPAAEDPGTGDKAPADQPPAAPPPPQPNSATIKVDGDPQQVAVKGTFPTNEPAFVLVSVAKKSAKIAVAGGSFASGKTITLNVGKKVVLVNTATNVRYELLLVRTENAATFASDAPATSSSTQPATTAANP